MGSAQIFFLCNRNRHIITSLMFLLVSVDTHLSLIAEGRPGTKVQETNHKGMNEEKLLVRAHTMGSRPPRCERRCSNCGHCEAVQVPVTTQSQQKQQQKSHNWRRAGQSSSTSSVSKIVPYSRGDDISNYKPMRWKCKCGDLFCNP